MAAKIKTIPDLERMISDLYGLSLIFIQVTRVSPDGDFAAFALLDDDAPAARANVARICERMRTVYRLPPTDSKPCGHKE